MEIRTERQFRALTGVTEPQLETIAKEFEKIEEEKKQEQGELSGDRKRKPGAGRPRILNTAIEKVVFVLYYLKNYPTYDVLGILFGMTKSPAFSNIQKYYPLVMEALGRLEILPKRTFSSVEEFREFFAQVEEILVDVTERQVARPKDADQQKAHYSGKKKKHTVKNTILVTSMQQVLYVGQTFSGHNHDYKMFKEEFTPKQAWLEEIQVLADSGYQGITKDYEGEHIQIPIKKPRKSKKNPNPTLTPEQSDYNKRLSRRRIFVENAISGMKRFNILVNRFRNRKKNFVDDVIVLCAGLWNLNVLQNA